MDDRGPRAQHRLPPTNRTPATDDFPTGPAIGDPLPEFVLPDQSGVRRSLSEIRGDGQALVVFYRSTRW